MNLILKYQHKINKPVLIADIFSAMVLLLFLYTAFSKLFDYGTFRFVLKKSPLLYRFAGFIAIALPIVELLLVLLLFIPRTRLAGLYVAFFLILLLTGYLVYMIAFTSELPCNCGGVLKLLTWKQHIFFNLFFILLSFAGILLYKRNKNTKSSPPP
jgi:hypothetical protein